MARRTGQVCLLALALAAAFGLGCAADLPLDRRGDADREDAGPGGPQDAAASIDASPPAARFENAATDPDDFGGCLDGTNADNDAFVDCADTDCAHAPVCCVGSTAAGCCAAGARVDVDLTACTATDCGPVSGAAFGAPRFGGGFRSTSADRDEGIVLAAPADLRGANLVLQATVRAGASADLDWVALGWVSQPTGSARVLPIVALHINPVLGVASLRVGETTVARDVLPAGAADFWIRLTATGVTAGVGLDPLGTALLTYDLAPAGGTVYPVVFGRSSASDGIAIHSLRMRADQCDIPSALTPRTVEIIDEASAFDEGTEANPSLASDGTRRVLVFDAVRTRDGLRRIFLAEETGDAEFTVRNPSPTTPQPLVDDAASAEDHTDPELRFTGTGWDLLFAGDANGRTRLLRAVTAEGSFAFREPMPIDDGFPEDIALDAPAWVPDAPARILARARNTMDGSSTIVTLDSDALDAFTGRAASGICGVDDDCSVPGARSSTYVVQARFGTAEFDSDEVDSPSAISIGGVRRMYYVGRRGTRWTLSVVVSEDGSYWRRLSDTGAATDIVLGQDDVAAPLGVRGVSVLAEGRRVTVVGEADFGSRTRIFIASQQL